MKVYVAGPMRGYDNFNYPMFDACRDWLVAESLWTEEGPYASVEIVSPADEDRRLGKVREYHGSDYTADGSEYAVEWLGGDVTPDDMADLMRHDLRIVTECDRLYLLPGWQKSTGCKHEIRVALACGVDLYLWHPDGVYGPWAERVDDEVALAGIGDIELDDPWAEGNAAEVRSVNALTGGEKGVKPARFDLLPVGPLTDLAKHYGVGALKYEDRNWERGYEWSKSYAALMRHITQWWDGEDLDSETGTSHLSAVAFHAFALLEWSVTHPEMDDRPNGGMGALPCDTPPSDDDGGTFTIEVIDAVPHLQEWRQWSGSITSTPTEGGWVVTSDGEAEWEPAPALTVLT